MKTVIKIGTSTLAHAGGRLNIRKTEELCKVISDLKNCGHEIILVSSGAIGMGCGKLGLKKRPSDMETKQAAAAVGQCDLMYTYRAIVAAMKRDLASAGIPENVINILEDTSRASAAELMTANGYVDLLIPRGGAGLIKACLENATVPCIETGTGICTVYVDAAAS